MEKAKEELIADLYSLRAGLSVISENADEVKRLEQGASNILGEIYGGKDKVKQLQDSTEKTKKQIEEVKAEINRSKVGASRKYGEYSVKLLFGMIFVWALLDLLGIPALVFYTGLYNKIGAPWNIVLIVCLYLGSFVYLVIIVPIRVKKKDNQRFEKQFQKEREEAKAENEKINEKIRKEELIPLEDLVKESEKLISEQKNKIEDFEKQLSQIKIENAPIIKEKIEKSKIIEDALIEKYNNLIIPNDWQNIDLIIFYLQTGRADNMKEALQLADRQRQTDAIVKEIRQANASICSEIRGGFRMLGSAMAQCFNLLSSQINAQHIQMVAALQSVADSQDKVVGAIDDLKDQNRQLSTQLVSATQLSNSLQAKANLTSDRLKSDLEYMQYRMGIRN